MPEGPQKRKMRKNEEVAIKEEVDIKEEVKEGIVDLFAGIRRWQSLPLVDEAPSVCPVCRLPLHLLSSSTSMPTPRVHMQDCKDGESNLLLRDFCPDIKDCRSQDIVHYSEFNHSLEDWHSYQEVRLRESYHASPEQQEGRFETDLRSEEFGMQSS